MGVIPPSNISSLLRKDEVGNVMDNLTYGYQQGVASEKEEKVVKGLLSECISLRGICRAVGRSMSWLIRFMGKVYDETPDDLNVNYEACKGQIADIESALVHSYDCEVDEA
jgi:hypothetical protein